MTGWSNAFFDFGGTLFSYAALGRRPFDTVERAAARLGIDADRGELHAVYGSCTAASQGRYADRSCYFGARPDGDFLDGLHEQQCLALRERFAR